MEQTAYEWDRNLYCEGCIAHVITETVGSDYYRYPIDHELQHDGEDLERIAQWAEIEPDEHDGETFPRPITVTEPERLCGECLNHFIDY